MERRQTVDNRGDRLLMIFTEPEGQDYWLKPGDKFEVRAPITSADAMFEIALHDDGVIVYPSHDMGYVSVWCNDIELDVGHQRPAGWGE